MAPSLVADSAYVRLILHAAKHPSRAVYGILLGKNNNDGEVEVSDSVALCHTHPLAPMTEVAFIQTSEYCRQSTKKGTELEIVGCYYAGERYESTGMDFACQKLADKIAENSRPALVLVVNNAKLADKASATTAIVCKEGNRWVQMDESNNPYASSLEAVERTHALIRSGDEQKIADFDEHLEDASLDWFNRSIE